jgi:hypothetical protein
MPQQPAPQPTPFDIIDPTAVPYPMLYIILWLLGALCVAAIIRYILWRFKHRQQPTSLSIDSLIHTGEYLLREETNTDRLKSVISLLFHHCNRTTMISSADKRTISLYLYQPTPSVEQGKALLQLLLAYAKEQHT